MVGLFKKLLDGNARQIARYQKRVEKINALEPQFRALSDEALRQKKEEFQARLARGETLDDLLPEAFAAVREAGRRTIGLRHYDVQLIGGMILHEGKVAEMRTGEGKTLVATLPLYLNALTGRGVHLVTPNDYLAKFGAQWMGPIYHALGVSVSVIQSGKGRPDEASFLYDPDYVSDDDRYRALRPITRREAYQADITYGTNNEFGFDYLRDNMVRDLSQCVQRELYYAIVDEVDSILIDEARTPLIISGPAEESSELYRRFAQLVPRLHRDEDYEVDEKTQVVMLTEEGITKVERMLGIPEGESIYDPQHAHMLPYLDNALRAKEFFHRDKEYVIREGEIIIVDQFTGRLMFGRRYSEGLHQAIEAKEGVKIRRESLTYATITFQNFFRMYEKLAGMTGTAATEAEELHQIYDLDVVILPTNVEYRAQFGDLRTREVPASQSGVEFAGVLQGSDHPVTLYEGKDERYYRRLDLPDQIYKTEAAKFRAVIAEIEAAHRAGRPVLVGTTAIETSERLSHLLRRRGIPHNVLNAKYHEKEAVIIAQAGRPGAVTIATNMAGRGVDILLGGNAENLAREAMRKEGIDLLQIAAADWDEALKMAKRGEDPTTRFPTRWAEILRDKVRRCEADRETVYRLGGLHVIGTERHEARRIDNQLRGRAGRQGDPGSSRFYISLEDEIMRRFGGEKLQPWMERAGLDDAPMEFRVLSKVIESIQERVEGYNFDIRKHVLEYDNVVNKQREVVYAERRKILSRDDLHDDLMEMVEDEVRAIVNTYTQGYPEEWNLKELLGELRRTLPVVPSGFQVERWAGLSPDEIIEQVLEWAEAAYRERSRSEGMRLYRQIVSTQGMSLRWMEESREPFYRLVAERVRAQVDDATYAAWAEHALGTLPPEAREVIRETMLDVYRLIRDRNVMIRVLDGHWVRHLTDLDILREGIGLRAIGQQNPLVAYQREAYEQYQKMLEAVKHDIVRDIFLQQEPQRRAQRQRALQTRKDNFRAVGGSANAASVETKRRPVGARKLRRNDPCWCGSGKKYKDCHWREDQAQGIVRYVAQSPQKEAASAVGGSRRRGKRRKK